MDRVTFSFFCTFLVLTTLCAELKLYPNLPVGEYKLKFKAAFTCNSSVDYLIRANLHLSRISKTVTALTGNITTQIPFDDSIHLNLNMAVLDKIGGWKDNAFVYDKSNACSTLKYLMGNVWKPFVNSMNITNYSCPFNSGFYVMKAFDISLLQEANFPKQFFYGTYKLKTYYTDTNKNIVGCSIIVVEFLRPWE
ncbi:uncharacterized protein LOC126897290 [Daktulosphaira vitifoliae]|uniref:uncharacterized protein LOC126897290 n=1 Tax=Daktulosphaira vitifoliae TaxID=58002 RepID=UPI0021AAFC18|nr:uncharacterized protein LOC126897290 [Daktulosphaira vitifoliae]